MAFLLNNESVAMIPSAGFGSRLKELSISRPKPLIELCGIAMLERACVHLSEAGFKRIAINTHYLAEQIHNFIPRLKKKFPNVNFHISHEPEILNIGGGIKKVAFDLNLTELLIFNADAFLYNESNPLNDFNPLNFILETWDANNMDALMYLKNKHTLMPPLENADFNICKNNKLARSSDAKAHEYLYCGISIYNTKPLLSVKEDKFHIMKDYVFPKMLSEHQFYGLEMNAGYIDIGVPENLEIANKILMQQAASLFIHDVTYRERYGA